jgi:hypothetical protein
MELCDCLDFDPRPPDEIAVKPGGHFVNCPVLLIAEALRARAKRGWHRLNGPTEELRRAADELEAGRLP